MEPHVVRVLTPGYTLDVDLKDWVKTERLARGWTQQQLADAAGLDRVEVNALENGRNKGTTSRIRDSLARAFGIHPARVGGGDGAELPPATADDARPVYGNHPRWPQAEQVARTRPAAAALDERDFVDARGFSGVLAPHEVTPEFVLALAMAAREVRLNPGPSALDKKLDAQLKGMHTRYENRLAKQKASAQAGDGAPLTLEPPKAPARKKSPRRRG